MDSRYPGEFGLLPNGYPTLDLSENFYHFALDIYQEVIDFLSNKQKVIE
jgi:hypothetical protein